MRKLSTRRRALLGALALVSFAALANETALSGTAYAMPTTTVNIFVRDGSAPEPASGTSSLLFTVELSVPATAGGISVSYTTANDAGGANPATGGAACGSAGVDYVNASGTVNFAAGEQFKTIPVNVCADTVSPESDETLLLNLTGASGGNIADTHIVDGQAVGTITQTSPAGTFIISELRTSGPGGAGDDFVEMYNNTDAPLTVASSDASAGYGVFKMGADCNAAPVLVATIPNGTIIPARGHFLVVGSQYSLGSYATGDLTLSSNIESDRNVSVFSTADALNISTATRLDAVGFGSNTGGVCDLLREGNTLPPVSGTATQHSFFRQECDFSNSVGCMAGGNPKDTNDNAADFLLADTQSTFFAAGWQHLGAPGPENKTSPIRRDASGIALLILDATKSSSVTPNRVRDLTSNPGNNSTAGTLSIRRRVQNTTGASVTRLRFRIIEITTAPTPGGGVADLRAITSGAVTVTGINDSGTCAATGTPATAPCTATVQGTTLEQPPAQPNGGGYNSTLAAGIVTTSAPLANGASLDVQFLLGVQTSGTFRLFFIVEALP
jgi:hypothetical protein